MRVVALEEHYIAPDLLETIRPSQPGTAVGQLPGAANAPELAEVGAKRLASMDEAGITVQVLSAASPGDDALDPQTGPAFAKRYNDRLKSIVDACPTRYAGFAFLPLTNPEAAADELERSVTDLGFRGAMVHGTIKGRFLDDPSFEPLFARAEKLDIPIYLHPNPPPAAIFKAYYDNLPGETGLWLARSAWGWHAETAVHVLRMVLSGTFDRHPKLKLIVGHMGEGLPAMLVRTDSVLTPKAPHLKRSVSQTILDQVWITTSGLFTIPPFMAALTTFGADRIMFSVDYPFSSNLAGRRFLDALPVAPADKEKIAFRNADSLLKLPIVHLES